MPATPVVKVLRTAKRFKRRLMGSMLMRPVMEYRSRQIARSPFFKAFPSEIPRLVASKTKISESQNYIYSRMPKAANSTVALNLMRCEGMDSPTDQEITQFKISGRKLDELSQSEIDRVLSDYYIFTLVRDPYSRVYSAFLDRVRRNKGEAEYVRSHLGKRSGEISFDEFLSYLEEGGWAHDGHWAPQTKLMCLPAERFHKIAKMESLYEDLPEIIQAIYGQTVEIGTNSPHATNASNRLDSLSSTELQRLYKVYEADFDLLGYPSHRFRGARPSLVTVN